jgi:hypothetical protein
LPVECNLPKIRNKIERDEFYTENEKIQKENEDLSE